MFSVLTELKWYTKFLPTDAKVLGIPPEAPDVDALILKWYSMYLGMNCA